LIKKPFYFSIDLEDFTYNLTRNINLEPIVNREALILSYEIINSFCEEKLNSKKITFFTTGTVAETVPDLLKQIVLDGHEVGCHYHFHDFMYKESNSEISKNLEIAKRNIFKATGIEPIGFRAPSFSISRERNDIFYEIEKHFQYDSSYVLNLLRISKEQYLKEIPFTLENLVEIPIVPKSFFHKSIRIKSGGTFLRFFNKQMMKEVMEYNLSEGFTPQVYLHPYDYLQNREFWVPFKHFIESGRSSNLIKYFRQIQWIGIGNSSIFNKLDFLLDHFEHQGPMSQLCVKK